MRVMPRLSRAAWGLLAVLVVAIAGITHVVSVLALPWRSDHDAFARVAALVPPGGRGPVDGPQGLPFADPAMLTEACRFDLDAKPFRLALSPLVDGFVTIGFHSRHGVAFYGLTMRAGDAAAFDLELRREAQGRSGDAAEQDAQKVVVVPPEPQGFVTLATPLGDGSDHSVAEERLGRLDCRSDAASAS